MFLTLLNGLAWLLVIAVGVLVASGVGYVLWRMAMEVLGAISDIPTSWRTRARRRERTLYDRAFRRF